VTFIQPARRRTAHASHHARLLRALADQPTGAPVAAPLDAIIVPAARRVQALQPLIGLAARAETLLVVLTSHDCVLEEVAHIVTTTPGSRAVVAEVPPDHAHALIPGRTSHDRFRRLSGGRRSNLSHKRNLGLLLATTGLAEGLVPR